MCSLKFWSGGFFEDLKADYDLYYCPYAATDPSGSTPRWSSSAAQSTTFSNTKATPPISPTPTLSSGPVWAFSTFWVWPSLPFLGSSLVAWVFSAKWFTSSVYTAIPCAITSSQSFSASSTYPFSPGSSSCTELAPRLPSSSKICSISCKFPLAKRFSF